MIHAEVKMLMKVMAKVFLINIIIPSLLIDENWEVIAHI